MVEKNLNKAPDGGYGWVVCAVAFFICMVTEGIVNSCGVIMPFLIEKFKCSSSTAALIGSLQSGILFFVAIVICAIANKVGCR